MNVSPFSHTVTTAVKVSFSFIFNRTNVLPFISQMELKHSVVACLIPLKMVVMFAWTTQNNALGVKTVLVMHRDWNSRNHCHASNAHQMKMTTATMSTRIQRQSNAPKRLRDTIIFVTHITMSKKLREAACMKHPIQFLILAKQILAPHVQSVIKPIAIEHQSQKQTFLRMVWRFLFPAEVNHTIKYIRRAKQKIACIVIIATAQKNAILWKSLFGGQLHAAFHRNMIDALLSFRQKARLK